MQSGWRKAVLALFSALALCAAWAISARGQGRAVTGLATGPVDPAGPATAGDDWPSDVSQPFWDDGAYSDYVARFGIGHVIGQGVGYEDSFTTFDFLLPLIEEPNQSLFFSDLRLNLNNQATVAANVGLGFRQYLEDWNRTIGFLVYYDYRDTRQNGFHQLGFGFESLGVWDFRSNVYLPNLFDDDQSLPSRFQGNYLFIDRFEAALTGVDVELGVPLPELWGTHARLYGGYYHFDGPGAPQVDGWKLRSEVHWRNRLIADVSIQDDNHFGTTVNVGLVVYLFAPLQPPPPVPPYPPVYAFRRGGEPFRPRHVWRRLGERVQRQRYIVVTTHETLAEDPATGSPLLFLHAVPGAGGDGTIQSPYGSLTDALADPRASSAIVYTPFGGTFTENIALVDGAIVLSNGPVQQVQTQLGAQVLPYSGTSPDLSNLPQIVGNVAMANDARFSGFAVTGAVSGAGLSNVTLDKSQVNNNLGTALSLTDLSGQLTLTDLTLTGGPGAGHKGIELSSTAAGLVANLSNITVTDAGSTGIDIDGTAGPFTVTAFRNLSVQKAANGGVLLRSVTFDADPATAGSQQVDGGTMTVGNADSTTDVKGDGLNLTSPSGDLSFAVLDIFNDAGTGLLVDTKTGGTTFSLTTGVDSTINTTNGTALNVDPVTTDLRFDSITASGGTNGIVLDQVDPIPGSTVAFAAGSITISNTTGDGLRIVDSSGTYSFDNLSITGAGGHAVAASNVDQLTLTGGNVSITNPAQDAINVVDSNLTIEGITISSAGDDAIDVTSRDQDRTVSIQAVTIGAASDSGIVVTGEGTGRLNLTVVDSTITATRFGFNLTNLGTGGIDLTFDRNQTTSLTADAFRAVNRSATGELIIGMNDNTFAATNGRGIVIDPGGANLGLAFTGSTYDDATSIPPDTMGGVGPSHIVELLNGRFAVYNKLTGDRLLAKTLDEFWIDAGQTPQDSAFDPRILYDPATGRWFAASVDDSDVPNNFLLAVSDGSDPTAGWTAFKIDSDSDDLHWADFDALGIDGNAVYLAANMPPIQFAPPGTASEISVLSIPKADLIAPVPTVANATLNEHLSGQGIGFAVQPVVDLGPADGPEPLLAVADGVGTFTVLKRTNVENASTAAATVSATTDITVAEYSEPPEADQPGTAQNLDAGDSRFSGNVVEVGDSLWAVHSVQDPATGNVAIRWYEIDEATNAVKQSGTISHPDLDYFYPSIAVNSSGDVVIGFSASSNNQAASAYAVVGETSAGATRFSTPIELQAGQGEYQRLDADRVNRWGDYSATVVDPSDPNKFWTFQEFVSEQNKWAIRIAEIQPDGSGGGGPTTIRSFSDNVVTTSGAGGIVLNGVSFDADPNLPGNQAVRAGRTSVGSQTAPARGDGVVISNATGTVQFTDLDVFTQNGTALAVFDSDDIRIDTPGTASSFLGTTNAPAVQIVNSTVDMKIHTVDVENAATAIDLNTVSGSFAVTGDGATPGSGGLIRHIGRADRNASAVQISDSDAAVSLNLLQITSMGDDADRAVLLTNDTNPLNVTVEDSVLMGNADNWIAFDVASRAGGSFVFRGNQIQGTTSDNQRGISFLIDGQGFSTPNASLAIDNNAIVIEQSTGRSAVNLTATGGGTINPLSGSGNTATDGVNPLTGTELFNANGTDANISGTLSINGTQVFP